MSKYDFVSQETNLLTYLINSETSENSSDTSSQFLSQLFSDAYINLLNDGLIELTKDGFVKITEAGEKALMDSAQNLNYTNPNDLSHSDSPRDWLNSALIFARTLGLMLQENEGIVVDLKGDMKFEDPSITSVIVINRGSQIHIVPNENDYPDGEYVSIVDSENDIDDE
jgi:hypothetical protein